MGYCYMPSRHIAGAMAWGDQSAALSMFPSPDPAAIRNKRWSLYFQLHHKSMGCAGYPCRPAHTPFCVQVHASTLFKTHRYSHTARCRTGSSLHSEDQLLTVCQRTNSGTDFRIPLDPTPRPRPRDNMTIVQTRAWLLRGSSNRHVHLPGHRWQFGLKHGPVLATRVLERF